MSSVLEDLLDEEVVTPEVRIQVQHQFDFVRGDPVEQNRPQGRSKTPGDAKSILEFYDLVRRAIDDDEMRIGVSEKNKIIFTEEDPDVTSETETVTFSLLRREPGQFGQGPPFGAKHHNLRPMLREELPDEENPGYRIAINGYWYDNLVRFTCWARTNKAANARAMWFEDMMERYTWWYRLQGVARVIFWGRQADIVTTVDNNKWYGRPIDFFVRTEKVRQFEEKTLEQILIKIQTSK